MNNKVKQLVGLAVTTATMTPMATPVHAHAESVASTTTVSLKKEGIEARQGTQVIEGISEEVVETPVMTLAGEEVATEEGTINVNPAFHQEVEAIAMMNLVEAQGKVDQANKEMEEAKLRDEQLQQELAVANENLEKAEEDVIVAQEAYDKAVAESDDIDEADVIQVRADNGITFQTCITDTTNLMVHYVPVGAGSPYSWEIYPYVTTDGEYIGFWREDYYN